MENYRREFIAIIREFVPDLLNTFPEYKEDLHNDIISVLEIDLSNIDISNNEDESLTMCDNLFNYCKNIYPERFFDIIYKNEEMFEDPNINTEFLPNIDFKELWKQNISDKTKEILWGYLQFLLYSILPTLENKEMFGDTEKLFNAINEDEFKTKLEETWQNIGDLFDNSNISVNDNSFTQNIPNPDEIHKHLDGMFGGKIGNLAKEIAEETAKDLEIDLNNVSDVNNAGDLLKTLFKNPKKLMSIVNNVQEKLNSKMSSGEIKQEELMEEATEIMKNMNNLPGMENIQNMLSKMGMPMGKNTKMNMGAFKNEMSKNSMREGMLKRLEKRKQMKDNNVVNNNIIVEDNVTKFVKGDKPEKSKRKKNDKRKKRKNKK